MRKLRITLLLFWLVFKLNNLSYSQTCFLPLDSFAAQEPRCILTHDFNKDGNLDLAVANYSYGTISVFDGDGLGNFGPAVSYAVGSYPTSMVCDDFNNDTIPDLAVTNWSSTDISILLGNGSGGFNLISNLTATSANGSIASGDFNGDNNVDLVITNYLSFRISILLGNGSGNFVTDTVINTGTHPNCVITKDFNNDNNLDIAVLNSGSTNISVILGNGSGYFTLANTFYSSPSSTSNIYSYNYNSDSFADLIVVTSTDVLLMPGNGTATFGSPISLTYATVPSSIAYDDFDMDAKMDLAISDYTASRVAIMTGDNIGNFTGDGYFHIAGSSLSLVSGDFNGDTLPDIAAANYTTNYVSILINCAVPDGIDETINNNQTLLISPNPSNSIVNITGIKEKSILYIYDMIGNIVFIKEIENNYDLDISNFSAGFYNLVNVSSKGGSHTKLIVSGR